MKVFEKSSRRELRQIFPCSAVEIDFRLGRLSTQCKHSLLSSRAFWPRASLGHLPETLVRLQRRYYLSPSGMLQRKCYSALTSTWRKREGMSYTVFEKDQTIWTVFCLCEHHGEGNAFPHQPALDIKYFRGWIVSLHASESPNLEILWWMLGKNPEKKSKLVWWGKLWHL